MNLSQTIYRANKLNQMAGSNAVSKMINALNKKTGSVENADENGNTLSADEKLRKFTEDISEQLKSIFDPTNGMTDEQKEKYRRKIMAKIESGKKLTAEEMRYIQINMPELYPHVVRIQIQRKSLEEKLKHCESKEEAQKVYDQAVSNISEKDPMAKELYAAYDDAMKEYKKSDGYAALPATEEEAEEKKGNKPDNDKGHLESESYAEGLLSTLDDEQGIDKASVAESSYFPEDNMSISSLDFTA